MCCLSNILYGVEGRNLVMASNSKSLYKDNCSNASMRSPKSVNLSIAELWRFAAAADTLLIYFTL